jgi:hypothetical protein
VGSQTSTTSPSTLDWRSLRASSSEHADITGFAKGWRRLSTGYKSLLLGTGRTEAKPPRISSAESKELICVLLGRSPGVQVESHRARALFATPEISGHVVHCAYVAAAVYEWALNSFDLLLEQFTFMASGRDRIFNTMFKGKHSASLVVSMAND